MTEESVRNSGHLYPSARSSKVKIGIIPSNQGLVWVPSRRVLDQLFSQFLRYHASIRANPNWSEAEVQNGLHVLSREPSSEHNATYESILYDDGELLKQPLCETYKTSLGIGFRRQGPAIGFLSSCCSGNVSVISVTNVASVRCYTPSGAYDFPLSDPEESLETKCIRVGPGWPASRNHHAQVFLRGTEPPTDGATGELSISVYSVSDAIFLNLTTRHCATPVANQPGSFCDWKALFAEPQAPKHRGFTGSQQLVKYGYESRRQSEDEPQSSPQPTVYSTTWFSSDFHLAFGTYELDATQHLVNSTGFTALTVTNDTSTTTEPLYIHPVWVFASWEVRHGETIPANWSNPAARSLLKRLVLPYPESSLALFRAIAIMSIHSIVMTSALTVINYDEVLLNDTTVPTAASTRYNWTNGAGRTMENVITSEVWLYNLASRSRVLALVVAAVGCVSVGLSFVLSVAPWPYTSKPEVLTLFREALGQHPRMT
jgi:hypothetical protein